MACRLDRGPPRLRSGQAPSRVERSIINASVFSYAGKVSPLRLASLGSGRDDALKLHLLPSAALPGALELAAGGEDVSAARRADGGAPPAIVHDLGEAVHAVVGA